MLGLDTDRFGRSRAVRTFALELALVLAVFTTLVFVGLYFRTQSLVINGVREEATAQLDLLNAARSWNAAHGGIWVVTEPGAGENRFLKAIGIDATTQTASGTRMALMAPEPMAAEISKFANTAGKVMFRLTSLKPLNPANRPTAWEAQQLARFETDPTPVSAIQNSSHGRVLRMMRPLVTEEACLRCHAAQGYKLGDIRGGVSVTVPLANADAELLRNALILGGLWIVVMLGLGVVMFTLFYRMAARVDETEDKLRRTAATDELTGLPNRRAVLDRLTIELARAEREASHIGVLSLDVDRFKRVNDTHGHAAGDAVLRGIAERLTAAMREYDSVGRIGGEEFLVVAPDVDLETLTVLAERLRAAVDAVPVRWEHVEIPVTVSVGAALWAGDESCDSVMRRADEALYRAKDAGRNRVEIG